MEAPLSKAALRPWLVLSLILILMCARMAWCHLSEFRMLEAGELYSFQARVPFTYRFLLPLVLQPLGIDFSTCTTHLNFPIASCADGIAFVIDSLSLITASWFLLFALRNIAARKLLPLSFPELAIPVFLWSVTFNYLNVPNSSIYYAYDFPELMFFSLAAWLGSRGGTSYLFLPVLIFVASFNKETSLFMIPVYLVYAMATGTLTRPAIVSAIVSVLAVVAVKYISYAYVVTTLRPELAANPTVYEIQTFKNLRQLANPLAWFAWLGVFGGGALLLAMPGPPPQAGVCTLMLAIGAVLLGWLAILMVIGLPREMRLFGPMIYLVILPLMIKIEALLYAREVASAVHRDVRDGSNA